ncbi:MAG: choice-of-anchor D domain-containing protein [Verrucomicrobiota bacterium]
MIKLPPLTAILLLASIVSSPALTPADLAPAAIVGKTLTFHYETGEAPFATSGSWTCTFGPSPGNVFTKTRITGDATNTNGTWSFNSMFSDMYEYTIVHYLAGQPDGILTLWVSEGEGRYEVFLNGVFGNSQTGGFSINQSTVKGPEIAISQPKGGKLTDGASGKNFGNVLVSKTGTAEKFIIKNSGTSSLKNLAITIDGRNKTDFIIGALKKNQLAAGDSTEFTVKFKPKDFGTRKAVLHVKSNDKDEASFDIKLTGAGVGIK